MREPRSGEARRTVVVPIGAARLRDDSDDVVLDTMKSAEVATLPAYRPDTFDDAYEADVRTRFAAEADAGSPPNRYDHELYDDSRFYGPRRS